ncbi:MAG: hypothetical protein V2A61_01150 [Calditrichota bacterium]
MTAELTTLIHQVKRLPRLQRGELMRAFFDDPELREDLLDLAALLEAESEPGEAIELEEFLASVQNS